MRLYEHEAKQVLARHRVALPQRTVATTAAEAAAAASEIGRGASSSSRRCLPAGA